MSWLLDALGYAGDTLNKPGRAVRGLLSGKLDEGLAAVPFSDSLGLTDPTRSTGGKELLARLGLDPGDGIGGDLAGFAAEVGTDPLTLAGAGLGRRLGMRAGEAAAARGPMYGTTAEDLARMAREAPAGVVTPLMDGVTPPAARGLKGDTVVGQNIRELLGSPGADRMMREIPPESKIIGAGAEATAFQTPTGDVLRVGWSPTGAAGRPVNPNVAPVTRTLDAGNLRAERGPLAAMAGQEAYWTATHPHTGLSRLEQLDQTMRPEGLKFIDRHAGNAGLLEGRPVVIDPGALDVVPGVFQGGRAPVTAAADPGPLMRRLLDAIGADRATRSAIEAGQARPDFGSRFGLYGGLAGADAGILGRSMRGQQ